jgi:hypothetical protein
MWDLSGYLETIPTNFPHRAQWSLCNLEQTPFCPGEIRKEKETPDPAQTLMDISQS